MFVRLMMVASLAVSVSAQTSEVQEATAAMNRGDNDAAIQIMEKAVAQYPNSAEAHCYLSVAYGSKGQQAGLLHAAGLAGKARVECEKAVALNPKYVEARFGLAQFYAAAPGVVGGS